MKRRERERERVKGRSRGKQRERERERERERVQHVFLLLKSILVLPLDGVAPLFGLLKRG